MSSLAHPRPNYQILGADRYLVCQCRRSSTDLRLFIEQMRVLSLGMAMVLGVMSLWQLGARFHGGGTRTFLTEAEVYAGSNG